MKLTGFLVLLVAVVTAVAPTRPDAPAAVTVTIGLADGGITVAPDPATVTRGDTLVFRAEPGSGVETFNVQFRSPDPFGQEASVAGFNGRRGRPSRGVVRPAAEMGRSYKYNVRVWDGQRTLVLDPEIIIGPGQ